MLLEDKMLILEQLKKNKYGYDYYKYATEALVKEEQNSSSGLLGRRLASFVLRLTIALLLFTVYFFMEERNLNIYEFTADRITEYLANHYFVP